MAVNGLYALLLQSLMLLFDDETSPMSALSGKNILLIVTGGIAAYKALELIRLIRRQGGAVRCILTEGGQKFVTPLSVAALSENPVYTDLFSLKDETEMGHIRLSREADLIVVAPASADFIAKMAHGLAGDLATAALLAADRPVLIAPAMNGMMWAHPATQHNAGLLRQRGVWIAPPEAGAMACGETGEGRMAEPETILAHITGVLSETSGIGKALTGLKALVTSGPTYEPLDPVRFIGNRSSGKQGHAVARALAQKGAAVTLVTGPVSLPDPENVKTIHVETALQMREACRQALPADIAVCAAAVSDWAPEAARREKIKKGSDKNPPEIRLIENPDILAGIAQLKKGRPALVIGFAAETENLLESAREKRRAKGCDWLIANDVGGGRVFGANENHVYLVTADGIEEWPKDSKKAIAEKLASEIAARFPA